MKKLTFKNLEKSIKTAENQDYFERLNKIYEIIPQGKCHGCTKCCMESVPTYYIEFLNILQFLQENRQLYEELLPKILSYYFLEMVQKEHCPFLNEEGLCRIYYHRPLTCRLFGHWNRDEYEENYKNVLADNLQNVKFFKNHYGMVLPEEVVTYKIDYCESFEVPKRILNHQRQSMMDNLFTMESAFFMRGLITEDYIGLGLVSWFAYTLFEREEAGELRLQIMEEYLEQGESQTLQEVLKKVKLPI